MVIATAALIGLTSMFEKGVWLPFLRPRTHLAMHFRDYSGNWRRYRAGKQVRDCRIVRFGAWRLL